MRIIPAIDLMDGKCVRLVKGKKENTVYYEKDPIELAGQYITEGAGILHVVDLDGAFTGKMENIEIVREIAKKFPVQVGGGVRNEDAIIELLNAGAKKVILGSMLIKNPELAGKMKKKYAGRVIGSFDFNGGKLAYEGWVQGSTASFENLVRGFDEIIVTDTTRDGTLIGPNIELLKSIKSLCAAEIIAAGGVGSLADIIALENAAIDGAILGKSLLDGRISLKEAIKCSLNQCG